MSLGDVTRFLQDAFEFSVHLAPRDPGLSREEIHEIGKRLEFQPGEIEDALANVTAQPFPPGGKRLLLNPAMRMFWPNLGMRQDPDYRNVEAFDFVYSALNDSVRALGAKNAQLEQNIIVERAVAHGLPKIDVEAAITILVLSGQLIEGGGDLRYAAGGEHLPLPGKQWVQSAPVGNSARKQARERTYQIVKDVIERRTDGRQKYAEPLDAFAEALSQLGYGQFRLWWTQIVAELRHSSIQASPVSVLVLAAALVEGALTFVVRHAQGLGLGVLGSKDFEKDPRTWKIDDLVSSAAAGKDTAILDPQARQRAEGLCRTRQRIHAGRMLSEFLGGAPDLRPEEAREAKAVAELVVRRVLDWLEKYPAIVVSPLKP